mgnify:FL=1
MSFPKIYVHKFFMNFEDQKDHILFVFLNKLLKYIFTETRGNQKVVIEINPLNQQCTG